MRIELLPPARWLELKRALEESRSDEPIPKPDNSIILSASEGAEMVGCIGASRIRAWCVSPFWVKKEFRGSGLALSLVERLAVYNSERLPEICVTTSPHVERLIHQMGFTPVLGQLWRRDVE